jgi:hypothetical protein
MRAWAEGATDVEAINRLACVAIDLLPAARHVEALGLLELGAAIISIQSSRV